MGTALRGLGEDFVQAEHEVQSLVRSSKFGVGEMKCMLPRGFRIVAPCMRIVAPPCHTSLVSEDLSMKGHSANSGVHG